MDPKQNGQLDPKLQEAYDRVMGTPLGGDASAAPQATATPVQPDMAMPQPTVPTPSVPSSDPASVTPPTNPSMTSVPSVDSASPVPPTPSVAPANPSVPSVSPTPVDTTAGAATVTPQPIVIPHSEETVQVGGTGMDSLHQKTAVAHVGSKKGISPVLIILGGVVFLLAYTVLWMKFFNAPLPFVGQ